MIQFFIKTCTIILLCLFSASKCMALDISLQGPQLILSGEIGNWDVERVARHLFVYRPMGIAIDSPGGDVAAAIRIAALIRGARVRVVVTGNGGFCASSCFFLFLAGEGRTAQSANENGRLSSKWQATGIGPVGIHRPYVTFSKESANSEMAHQDQVVRDTSSYLQEQRVPQHLIDEMLSRPSNDIYWLTEKDLNSIGPYSAGYEEALVSKCGFVRISRQFDENWSDSRVREYDKKLLACEGELWTREILPLQRKFYSRLQSGWRPWDKK